VVVGGVRGLEGVGVAVEEWGLGMVGWGCGFDGS